MARSINVFLLALTLIISVNQFADGFNLPEAINGRIESKPGKRCLLYRWDVKNLNQPCTPPDFNFTLSILLFKSSGSSMTEIEQDVYSRQQPGNSSIQSFSECLYDSSENISCCQDISSQVRNKTSGREVSFSNFERITVAVTICAGGINSAFSPGPAKKILPWRDPCFTYKPCQQLEFAVCNPAVDDYYCSCQYQWTGKNCTVPRYMTDMTYHASRCLNVSSETGVQLLYGKNVAQCKSVCSGSKCKSFEFRRTPSSLKGNCTLRYSNSLQHRLVPCDADLYQLKSFFSSTDAPSSNSTASTPTKEHGCLSTAVIVIIVIIGVLVLAFIVIVLVIKPFETITTTPSRSHSNLGALPPGTHPRDQETTPLAPDKD
ncbi:uncharacterized protein LOC116301275 [Actinia tenebrosa]|uniref:Uncharacterized protein LOC116301275 n=1 Tax=Actinia tenebrosa TaxID=6105 RepID=A0A6P8IHZ5_ACTTE|nr:uncharacterized protein LOC116301275 [Actinia tenebrosa]